MRLIVVVAAVLDEGRNESQCSKLVKPRIT